MRKMPSARNYEEAELFWNYMKENWAPTSRIHVDDMRELHGTWSDTNRLHRSWRSLHEIIKRCKGLRNRKHGFFSLTNTWSRPGSASSVSVHSHSHNRQSRQLGEVLVDTDQGSNFTSVLPAILQLFRRNRKELQQDKYDVEVGCDSQDVRGAVQTIDLTIMLEDGNRDAKEASTDIQIVNKSHTRRVQLRSCGLLYNNRYLTLHDDSNVSCGLGAVDIGCGENYAVRCCFKSNELGCRTDHVAFTFAIEISGKEKVFHIVRRVRGRCTTNLCEEVRSKERYVRRRVARRRNGRNIEAGQQLYGGERLLPIKLRLEKYGTEDVDRMMNNGQPTDELIDKLLLDLETNHAEVFHCLLKVEEIQMWIDIRYYDMEGATMKKVGGEYFALKVPGLAEKRPSLLKGDRLFASLPDVADTEFEGYVHFVRQDEVWLKFSSRFHANLYVSGMKVNIRFTFNRLPLQLQHRALDINELPPAVLFPYDDTIGKLSLLTTNTSTLRYFDRDVERNVEQNTAVKNIVSGISRPAPYIIFGPPGTGKTMTTVEAIRQVLHVLSGSRVLACAPSNSAADLICQRLLKVPAVSKNEILRFNALSRDERDIPQDLTANCKSDLRLEELLQYRVVVCTLVTAGKIVSAAVPRGHFTHVFIDESGHAVEPECVIPITGLVDAKKGQIVLAGDPQQLGPVLRSSLAIENGLQISLLERLMERKVYERRDTPPLDEPPHNPRCVTKLLNNYRSHPDILYLPNRMFYNNELKAEADKMLRSKMCSWDGLVTQGFPLIFHGIVGEENQEANSPSFFNPEEICVACDYLQKLKSTRGPCKVDVEKDVGIISPYRKQVQKIRRCLEKQHIGDVKVGSVEEFQGQERTVIIITTVRSNADHLEIDKKFNLGFLRNPKRFNVAITRAKALLIVIGNPNVLIRDEHWKHFLKYVNSKGGYKGCPFPSADADDDSILENLQELELHTTDAYTIGADEESQLQQHIEPEWRGEH